MKNIEALLEPSKEVCLNTENEVYGYVLSPECNRESV